LTVPRGVDLLIGEIDKQMNSKKLPELRRYVLEMRRYGLLRKWAEMLEFGTKFDWGKEEAAINYYETQNSERKLSGIEKLALGNRRILFWLMSEAGFEAYPDEWWHFNDPKSQMGAKTAGIMEAKYGAARLDKELIDYENMRRGHLVGNWRLQTGRAGLVLPWESKAFIAVLEGSLPYTDFRYSKLPTAARISPFGNEKN
jgi:hypothetical protein